MKKNKNLIKEEKGTKKKIDIEIKVFIALLILIIFVGIILLQVFVESVTRTYYYAKSARNITTSSQIEELEETLTAQNEEINNLKNEIEDLDSQMFDLMDRLYWVEREVMW